MAFITTKGVYGLSAMYELTQGDGVTPMQIKNIAQKAGIPFNYLEQLLNQLRRAGLINSVRGAKGGYILARTPDRILIYDILVALEGELVFAEYTLENKILSMFFDDMQKGIEEFLKIPLSEFQKYANILLGGLTYSI
ncbi:MAG: Rrf2 family transcriptional regulator [Campylobacteraceae bacterium]|jgi:Rrf2 family protein|nr:Rrf2 family transcriptional regulator [Campylobacteraceae bacterium]